LRTKTLGDIYDRKNNSFDELRFFLASLVLYVHSYALLYGENGEKDFFINLVNYQIGLSAIAVYGFFVLSGFL
jgi:peptidoglycan/LPS O-acetylase OafA/YrhL